jgi:aspartate aminotransferase
MEYLPIEGLTSFIQKSLEVAYSKDNKALQEKRIVGVQALSGTGSLRVGFEFFNEFYPGPKKVLIPNPSWPNHKNCVARSGMTFGEYRYYDNNTKSLDMNGMLEDLDRAEDNSIVLLHVCAHNPTGMDPSKSQWDDIYNVVKKKSHFPFFDMAYQGFATGDLEKDSWALGRFSDEGMKLALAQSYAKNFGLYGQRVGCFSILTDK